MVAFLIVPQRPHTHANRRARSRLRLSRNAKRGQKDIQRSSPHGFLKGECASSFAATSAASEPRPAGT